MARVCGNDLGTPRHYLIATFVLRHNCSTSGRCWLRNCRSSHDHSHTIHINPSRNSPPGPTPSHPHRHDGHRLVGQWNNRGKFISVCQLSTSTRPEVRWVETVLRGLPALECHHPEGQLSSPAYQRHTRRARGLYSLLDPGSPIRILASPYGRRFQAIHSVCHQERSVPVPPYAAQPLQRSSHVPENMSARFSVSVLLSKASPNIVAAHMSTMITFTQARSTEVGGGPLEGEFALVTG